MRKKVWPDPQAKRKRISYFTIVDYGNGFKVLKWYKIIIANGKAIDFWKDIEEREYSLSHRKIMLTEEDFEPLSHRTRKEEDRLKMEQIAYYWPIEKVSYVNTERRI